jgi:hypothetical protein
MAGPPIILIVGGVVVEGTPIPAEEYEQATGVPVGTGWIHLKEANVAGRGRGWFRCQASAVQGELYQVDVKTGRAAASGPLRQAGQEGIR